MKIVRNLLMFSKRVHPKREEAEINASVDETIAICEHHLDMRGIKLTSDLQAIPPFPFDIGQLQQVFLNLIMNASQAIENEVGGEVKVSTIERDGIVYIRVTDNGVGIPEENLERIFIPFFTTKLGETQSDTDVPGIGTGLGLFISNKIVHAHNGNIVVKSRVGSGTTFEVQLPIDPEIKLTETAHATHEEPDLTDQTSAINDTQKALPKTMIVDDEADIRCVLCKFLEDKGFPPVVEAENGLVCIEKLKQDPDIKLIFMDVMMPHMDGVDTLKIIKRKFPDKWVYMMSGYGTKPKVNSITELGAKRFFAKPFDIDEIEKFIDKDLLEL